MADLASYENKVAELQAELNNLRSRFDSLEQQQNDAANAANRRRENLIASGLDPAEDAEYQSLASRSSALNSQLQGLSNQISQIRRQLAVAQDQLQREQAQQRSQPSGTDSSGQIVREDSGATGASPSQKPPATGITPEGRIVVERDNPSGSNAVPPVVATEAGINAGTNAPTVTLQQSQATSGPNLQGSAIPARSADTVPVSTAATGVGAGIDETTRANTTQQEIQARFGDEFIGPQPNILDNYASYTYNAEWHLVTPEQLNQLISSRGTVPLERTLLMRSGGANQTTSTQGIAQGGTRSPVFDLDFYMDDIVVENVVLGKGTGSSHNYSKISFRVIEPLGITFFDRLYQAVNVLAKITSPAAALYVMIITFYGYDVNGKLVKVGNQDVTGDPYAIVKKIIPFKIENIKFVVEGGPVQYNVTGVATQYEAVHVSRGSIPYPIEIRGSTVGEMLGDKTSTAQLTAARQQVNEQVQANAFQAATNTSVLNAIQTTGGPSTAAPPKANAANQAAVTVAGNLMDALNKIQAKLVNDRVYEIADNYSIEFVEETIRSARTKKDLTVDYSTTPLTDPSNARSRLDDRQAAALTQRVLNIAPGTQIINVIDQVIRNSSYIQDQSIIKYDEVTRQQKIEANPSKSMAWYKINMVSTPVSNILDKKRNDYAYNIKFVVSFYQIQGMDSGYFPEGRVTVLHKSYPYWFTGQNTAVVEYRQTYNMAYNNTISGALIRSRELQTITDYDRLRKNVYSPNSRQNAAGAKNNANEPSANASEFLYDPTALGTSTMRIIGDPAWMLQGETATGVDSKNFSYAPFQPDGTINAERGEILYEIRWQKSQDYDTQTGLMKLQSARQGEQNDNVQSIVYKLRKVVSEFRNGKFEQTLDGVLFTNPVPTTANSNKAIGNATVSSAPTLTETNASILNKIAPNTATTIPVSPIQPVVAPSTSTAVQRIIDLQAPNVLSENVVTLNSMSALQPLPEQPNVPATSNADIANLPSEISEQPTTLSPAASNLLSSLSQTVSTEIENLPSRLTASVITTDTNPQLINKET